MSESGGMGQVDGSLLDLEGSGDEGTAAEGEGHSSGQPAAEGGPGADEADAEVELLGLPSEPASGAKAGRRGRQSKHASRGK